MPEFDSSFGDMILRWGHVLSGIMWIGLLYFFNMINGPVTGTMDADTKKKVVPELMYRCLFWFRWAAMSTLLFGLGLFLWNWTQMSAYRDDDGLDGRGKIVMWGMLFAVTMWFNVWFIIWPAQQKILPAVAKGEAPPAGLPRRAFLASRYNTYMSGPMLMMMLGAQHYAGGLANPYGFIALSLIIGLALMHVLIGMGGKVGKPPSA